MKGRAAIMKGVRRKEFFAPMGSLAAESAIRFVVSIASEVRLRAASAACFMVLLDISAGFASASWGTEWYMRFKSSSLLV